jgi:hypothetical protein
MLPDDVVLEIFDFYVGKPEFQAWITLVHVCRRWRSVVFQSPHRLNLQLRCTPKTRVRDTLDIWPPFPLIIHDMYHKPSEVDNIIAALERNVRVSRIDLQNLPSPQLEYVTAAMNKPFPELTDLRLYPPYRKLGSILPDSFLGGTAPRLQHLSLTDVPFPGLPKLLLSATHIVTLGLHNILPSGYFPPEVMATSLSALTNLKSLYLCFESPRPRPALESRRPPPPPLTRVILPSLTFIVFEGASEYLEVILARIDAPQLDGLDITFFNEVIFDIPLLFQFVGRTPMLRAPEIGRISFSDDEVRVKFPSQTSHHKGLRVNIGCTVSGWQLSAAEQVCTSFFPPVPTLENLYILESRRQSPRWQDDVESTLWLEVLRPFVAVKNLCISEEFAPRIAPALEELSGARTTEVLPTLENIYLLEPQPEPSRPLQEGIEKFIAARQLIDHPVAVFHADRYLRQDRYEWYDTV